MTGLFLKISKEGSGRVFDGDTLLQSGGFTVLVLPDMQSLRLGLDPDARLLIRCPIPTSLLYTP